MYLEGSFYNKRVPLQYSKNGGVVQTTCFAWGLGDKEVAPSMWVSKRTCRDGYRNNVSHQVINLLGNTTATESRF